MSAAAWVMGSIGRAAKDNRFGLKLSSALAEWQAFESVANFATDNGARYNLP